MYYIVGLGNPGEQYAATRHNAGWQALDAWVQKTGIPTPHDSAAYAGRVSEGCVAGTDVTVLYPSTFMNHSGSAVAKLVPPEEAAQLIVVYDDVAIPFGSAKVSVGGGAGGHNGIKSITAALGTPAYIRVRIGIAPTSFWTGAPKRPSGSKLPAFVLQPFTAAEQRQLPTVYETVGDILDTIVAKGVTTAMNRYN